MYEFRDTVNLSKVLMFLVGLEAILCGSGAASSYMQVQLFGDEYTAMEFHQDQVRVLTLTLSWAVVRLLTAITLARWIIRSQRNLWACGAVLPITPGWAVGYFFVPILSLWKPYQAMRDLDRASIDPLNWQSLPGSGLVKVWWALWLLSWIGGPGLGVIFKEPIDDTRMQVAAAAAMGASTITTMLCLVTFAMVKRISENQSRMVAREAPRPQDGIFARVYPTMP